MFSIGFLSVRGFLLHNYTFIAKHQACAKDCRPKVENIFLLGNLLARLGQAVGQTSALATAKSP
jgi:hypothetical protein